MYLGIYFIFPNRTLSHPKRFQPSTNFCKKIYYHISAKNTHNQKKQIQVPSFLLISLKEMFWKTTNSIWFIKAKLTSPKIKVETIIHRLWGSLTISFNFRIKICRADKMMIRNLKKKIKNSSLSMRCFLLRWRVYFVWSRWKIILSICKNLIPENRPSFSGLWMRLRRDKSYNINKK